MANAVFADSDGTNKPYYMGCYGIGVSRVVAAAIEQNHDDRGIIWPAQIAPFQVAIVPMNMQKSEAVQAYAQQLYRTLQQQGVEVIFDDRKERPGVMFADMELIGVPHTIVIGEKNLLNGELEYKNRSNGEKQMIAKEQVLAFLAQQLS